MRLILAETGRKRPYSSPLTVRFITVAVISVVVGAALLIANRLIQTNQMSQAVWVAVSVVLRLIPPIIWLGGFFILVLWLTLLTRIWRQ